MTETNAIEELLRLLDERGVDWDDLDGGLTWTGGDGRVHYARQEFTFGGLIDEVTVYHLTPEQAIAATLWSGAERSKTEYATLTADHVREAIFNGSSYASYDGAKYYADGIGMQAIADELNAALGKLHKGERELIDLAHNAWAMALCAMNGMPIPADWGNAVERGLREHGIDVDEELAAFEVIDDER